MAKPRDSWGGGLDDYDLVEVLDLTDPSPSEPPRLLEKPDTDINTRAEEIDGKAFSFCLFNTGGRSLIQ